MKMFETFLVIVAICANTGIAKPDFCPKGISRQDIDWKRLSVANKYWYDVIDIPQPAYEIDCWDWRNIEPADDGFTAELIQYVEGFDKTKVIPVHWILNTDGSYTWDPKHKEILKEKTKMALSHKINQQMIEDIDTTTDMLFKMKWWFMTDYEHYFIAGACLTDTGNEYGGFIKFDSQQPPLRDVLNVWNRFSEMGETPLVYTKQTCINRSVKGK